MKNCFFWGNPGSGQWLGDARSYYSQRTDGKYRITSDMYNAWEEIPHKDRLDLIPKFTTWIVDQHKFGTEEPTITVEILDLIRSKRFLRHSERVLRFFQMLVDIDFSISSHIRIGGIVTPEITRETDRIAAWIEARNQNDVSAFLRVLQSAGLLTTTDNNKFFLTAAGLERLEQAEVGGAQTNQAFVAMWFGAEMDIAYSHGIAPAIEDAGFRPFRIDRKEHNNKIDDEIIAEIRRSRFMIADFTCATFNVDGGLRADARGGVYYEAGFAQGLGMPLIWTVRSDCIGLVHFDTRQFAHIVWESPSDLKRKLTNRIKATLP